MLMQWHANASALLTEEQCVGERQMGARGGVKKMRGDGSLMAECAYPVHAVFEVPRQLCAQSLQRVLDLRCWGLQPRATGTHAAEGDSGMTRLPPPPIPVPATAPEHLSLTRVREAFQFLDRQGIINFGLVRSLEDDTPAAGVATVVDEAAVSFTLHELLASADLQVGLDADLELPLPCHAAWAWPMDHILGSGSQVGGGMHSNFFTLPSPRPLPADCH